MCCPREGAIFQLLPIDSLMAGIATVRASARVNLLCRLVEATLQASAKVRNKNVNLDCLVLYFLIAILYRRRWYVTDPDHLRLANNLVVPFLCIRMSHSPSPVLRREVLLYWHLGVPW